jgi:hypothetical protein
LEGPTTHVVYEVRFMSSDRHSFSRSERIATGSIVLILVFALAALLMAPATALGQGAGAATPTPTVPANASPTATLQAGPSLMLASTSGLPGSTVTANGAGFQPGETVDVSFNGQPVGTPTVNSSGTFSLAFTVPNSPPGQYAVVAKGRASGAAPTAAFTINQGSAALSFNPPQAAPGTQLTVTGTGFRPGETVTLTFNGPTVGTETVDTNGKVTFTFSVPPTLAPGQYGATATGETSGLTVNSTFTVVAGATPVATAAATMTPTPAPATAPATQPIAPAMAHDERWFSQTGYRIDDDAIWAFFQQFGGINTFGFPTSRNITFLGCPVQMFQRQIIQDCPGQGVALINMLDPEIFPYTQVNGSTFPGPDPTIKNNTPQVGSPTYSTDIINFVNQVVPNSSSGQPVNFMDHFNTFGGLTIWGAPISNPAPDPNNASFIYQRFQRGIMHFISGTGTESILLADWLKAIIMNQNVPADLLAQSRESRFFNQYCPDQPHWLCRQGDLSGTDLTFAFVQG